LKSPTISGVIYHHPLQQVIVRPRKLKLAEKILTTLRLHLPPKPLVWPNSLLQQLQTLEIKLIGDPGVLREYWTIVQKSTTPRARHITPSYGSARALSHPSVQYLSVSYPQLWDRNRIYSLEEVRMPRLQDVTNATSDPNPLTQLKLGETSALSLALISRPPGSYGDMDPAVYISWGSGIVPLFRSTSRLKKIEIPAPSGLVSALLEALEKDESLCVQLNTFIVNEP
jgi:hypothetical protein